MTSFSTHNHARFPSLNVGTVDIVFYDGHCGLCHRTVRFLLARDTGGKRFRFASLNSEAFRAVFSERERQAFPDSLIVRTGTGEVLTRSTAVLYLLRCLGGLWRVLGRLFSLAPIGVRDALYDSIARLRYRLFSSPVEACPLMSPELRSRFLD